MSGSLRPSKLNSEALLERRIAALERQLRQVPVRLGIGGTIAPTPRTAIQVLGGNSLGTVAGVAYTGIKPLGTSLTAVPAAVPTNGSTYADGLGYGKILDAAGVPQNPYVWIASKATPSGGSALQDYSGYLVTGCLITTVFSVLLPITGGGGTTAIVYLPHDV
jgi:hypothetical protein